MLPASPQVKNLFFVKVRAQAQGLGPRPPYVESATPRGASAARCCYLHYNQKETARDLQNCACNKITIIRVKDYLTNSQLQSNSNEFPWMTGRTCADLSWLDCFLIYHYCYLCCWMSALGLRAALSVGATALSWYQLEQSFVGRPNNATVYLPT